ncbi:TetR/AcrR family transcriptional regulator [Conexibacter sp. W3-3-2]|uniref:TetR/AcrR family transcriptional regulator n=1 Tax=Conexibacter sp. W3-3-2 TaxID=2675227 RepID=UPI0028157915|nr:TetR/AcrR family transcriptional regulator [Conexibacter sp. W3-3-2]
MATRPYHHGNLREELLDRALDTVRDRGVAALSLREVARDAGVSHAAPRRHFPDRQALLDGLAQRGFERLRTTLEAAAGDGRGPYAARLERVAQAYVAFAVRDAALLELMFAAKKLDPDGPLHEAAEQAFAVMLELLAEGRVDGELAGAVDDAVAVLFPLLHGLASLAGAGMLETDDLDATVATALRGALTGLRPR